MSGANWLSTLVAEPDVALGSIVRGIWARADRVDVAIAQRAWLQAVVAGAPGCPRFVRAVSSEDPGDATAQDLNAASAPDAAGISLHDQASGAEPRWSTWASPEPPVPEFLLSYQKDASFPDIAVLFTGPSDRRWATLHRRPVVLHRLREHFEALLARASLAPALSSSPSRPQSPRPESATVRECAGGAGGFEQVSVVDPAELYRLALAVHFADAADAQAEDALGLSGTLAAHQRRAYERACAIVDRYGGVIIADAVGLGKTYIGLRLLARALQAGQRALVIVPAALKGQWKRALAYLTPDPRDLDGQDTARAEVDNLDFWVNETLTGDFTLLSMEALGRPSFDPSLFDGADFVLVDEAHNFRNPSTRRHKRLAGLVRHASVVLMTATPINNSILDLQHILALFAAPSAFRHLGVNDYRVAFRRGDGALEEIRTIITACVLRRTRRFLRAHYGAIKVHDPLTGEPRDLRFPRRRPPQSVRYDLAGSYGELFTALESWMDGLRLPSLDPSSSDVFKETSAPRDLLKIILLKRLESSTEAFRSSLFQQLAWCQTALRALDAGRILSRPEYRSIFRGPADDPGSQLAFFELMLPPPPTAVGSDRLRAFRSDLEQDLVTLSGLHRTLAANVGRRSDCKFEALLRLLDGPLAGRKILIFTEFRDTARYLHRQLGSRPHLARIDSAQALLGREPASRREVIERFAPRSNGLPEPRNIERVDTLIATDVLSEGLNLQDASVVISYDLPWNPVRLMQRVGRIDRLGATADTIELYHFLPAGELERLLRLMERLQDKVSTIQATLGLDQPILSSSASPAIGNIERIRMLASDSDSLEALEDDIEGPEDPEELAYLDYVSTMDGKPSASCGGPAVAIVSDRSLSECKAFSYWRVTSGRQARGLWLVYDGGTGCVVEDQLTTLRGFKEAAPLPREHSGTEELARARRAFARYVHAEMTRLQASRIAGDELTPNLPQCRIAAWLTREFKAAEHRLDAIERTRIDGLLERLARRFTLAGERALARIANELPQRPETAFLSQLESALSPLEPESFAPPIARDVATLLLSTLPASPASTIPA